MMPVHEPVTPPLRYYPASEETPAGPSRIAIAHTPEISFDNEQPGSSSSYESGTTFDNLSEEEEDVFEDDRPLVSRRRDGTSRKDGGLLEVSFGRKPLIRSSLRSFSPIHCRFCLSFPAYLIASYLAVSFCSFPSPVSSPGSRPARISL